MKLSLTGDKLQLVFVNANETYLGDDLLELDINQNLWMQFHELAFDCMYLLSTSSSGFKISDFGDRGAKKFAKARILGGKIKVADSEDTKLINNPNAKEFKNVVLPEISKKKSAVVCSLSDFHSVMQTSDWKDAFDDFFTDMNGNAMLFLLVTSDTEKYLKSEDVYSILLKTRIPNFDIAINGSSTESLRNQLFDMNTKNCHFFDDMSFSDIRNILIKLMVQNPIKFDDVDYLDEMATYLSIVLDREVPLDRNLVIKNKVTNRRDCYTYLMNQDNWNRLRECSKYCDITKLFDEAYFSEELLNYKMTDSMESVSSILTDIMQCLKTKIVNVQAKRLFFCVIDLFQEYEPYSLDYETNGLILGAVRNYIRLLQLDNTGIENMRKLMDNLTIYKDGVFKPSKSVFANAQQIEKMSLSVSPLTSKMIKQLEQQILASQRSIKQKKDYLDAVALKMMSSDMNVVINLPTDLSDAIAEPVMYTPLNDETTASEEPLELLLTETEAISQVESNIDSKSKSATFNDDDFDINKISELF